MLAHQLYGYGGTDQLRLDDIPIPEPGYGQVRIVVRAIGINPLETKIRNGWLRQMLPLHLPAVIGNEAAGVVDAIGPGVHEFAPGERVAGFVDGGGSYAEYAVTRAATLARIPDGVSFAAAATVPVAAEAAQRALLWLAPRPAETFLVNGAAGAVGGAAVQLLARAGATVIGTTGPDNHDYVRALGGIPVEYGIGVADRIRGVAPGGIDAVLDTNGHDFIATAIELRGSTERIITTAQQNAAEFGVAFAGGDPMHLTADTLTPIFQLVQSGQFATEIAKTFDFSDLRHAQEMSEQGHHRGKIVVRGADRLGPTARS